MIIIHVQLAMYACWPSTAQRVPSFAVMQTRQSYGRIAAYNSTTVRFNADRHNKQARHSLKCSTQTNALAIKCVKKPGEAAEAQMK
jgi:hypothetical protein